MKRLLLILSLLALQAGSRHIAWAEPLLNPVATWESGLGRSTRGIAVGDVDMDGELDVVCANYLDTCTLYRSQSGVLETYPVWFSGAIRYNQCATLGDLDGDGDLDLVVGRLTDWDAVFRNDEGTLTTDPVQYLKLSRSTYSLSLGDVDNDGDLDLVAAGQYYRALYRNQAGVLDTLASVFDSGGFLNTSDTRLADLDGDGWLDLICANSGRNTVYLNDSGTYAAPPDWASPDSVASSAVAVGDVDGDSYLDVIFSSPGRCYLYRNISRDSSSVLSSAPVWSVPVTAVTSLSLGDLDCDGDLDLACGRISENVVFLNTGGVLDTIPAWTSLESDYTVDSRLADLDGNGTTDLVCANDNQGRNTAYLNLATCTPEDANTFWGEPGYVEVLALGDLDLDGDLDVVVKRLSYPEVYFNDGGAVPDTASWKSSRTTDGLPGWVSLALGDVDRDGYPDLAVGAVNPRAFLLRNSGGMFSDDPVWVAPPETVATLSGTMELTDVDGDDWLDLVYGGGLPSSLITVAHNNQEGGFGATVVQPVRAIAFSLGDIDGDGDPDLVCGQSTTTSLYLNDGSGSFDTTPLWQIENPYTPEFGGLAPAWDVALGDLDGDGDLDLAIGFPWASDELFLNTGGTFSTVPDWISYEENYTTAILFADVDADGDLDLVSTNESGGERNSVYLNRDGRLSVRADLEWGIPYGTVLEGASTGAAAGDLDGDGDLEVLFASAAFRSSSQRSTLHWGTRNRPGKPALPNRPPAIRSVRVSRIDENIREVSFTVLDPEGDDVRVFLDYQYRGDPAWHALQPEGRYGPYSTTPGGVPYTVQFDASLLPFDPRSVVLRLRAGEIPRRVADVREVPAYLHELGPLDVRRPRIALAPGALDFGTVTVGDTALVLLDLENRGTSPLQVTDVRPPSGAEIRLEASLPIQVQPGTAETVPVRLEPIQGTPVAGYLIVESNDPLTPMDSVLVQADIRPLIYSTRPLVGENRAPLGEALTFLITPDPGVRIEGGLLAHRQAGSTASYDFDTLAVSGPEFIATVPGHAVTEAGVEYYTDVWNLPVHALDPPGAPAVTSVIPVDPPSLLVVSPQPNSGDAFLEGRDIEVLVSLQEGTVMDSGRVEFRPGGGSAFAATSLRPDGAAAVGTIPGSSAGARGLEYRVHVDTRTAALAEPAAPDWSYLPVTVQDLFEAQDAAGEVYRMVSVPLDFGPDFSGTLESLLFDQEAFGSYLPSRWRSFRWANSLDRYVELSEKDQGAIQIVRPGRAFWLIARKPGHIRTAPQQGVSVLTDAPYTVLLDHGWNQVGNPFSFSVTWTDVMAASALTEDDLAGPLRWSPGERTYPPSPTLEPFAGYFVYNWGPDGVALAIPPTSSTGSPARPGPEPPVSVSWEVRIRGSAPGGPWGQARAWVSPQASDGWGPEDLLGVPGPPEPALAVTFPHGDWGDRAARYSGDGRTEADPGSGGKTWVFDVAGDPGEAEPGDGIRLEVAASGGIPDDAVVACFDRNLGRKWEPLTEGAYRFFQTARQPILDPADARFELWVGPREYIERRVADAGVRPARTRLHQNYPNPFRSGSVVRYELAEAADVQIRIFDVRGRLVRVLLDVHQPAGVYEIAWRGETDDGGRAGSGVYFYQLLTPTFREVRRMLKVE